MTIKKFLFIFVDFISLKTLEDLHSILKEDFNLQSFSMGCSGISPFKEYEENSHHTAFTPITNKIPNCCENIWIRTLKIGGFENLGIVLFLAELNDESTTKIDNPDIREEYEREIRETLKEKFQFSYSEFLNKHKVIILNWILYDKVIKLENGNDLAIWLKSEVSKIHPFGFNRFGWISLLDRNYLIFCNREIELTDSKTFPMCYSIISAYEPLIGSSSNSRVLYNFGPLGPLLSSFLTEFVTLLLARFIPYSHVSEINRKFSVKNEIINNISKAIKERFRIIQARKILIDTYSDQMKQRMHFIKFLEQISEEIDFSKKLVRIWKRKLDAGASMSWNELKDRWDELRVREKLPYEIALPYPLWWVDNPQIKDTNWGSESPIIRNLTESIDSALKYNERLIRSVEQNQVRVTNYISDVLNHINSRMLLWLTTAIFLLTMVLVLINWSELKDLFVGILQKIHIVWGYIATGTKR